MQAVPSLPLPAYAQAAFWLARPLAMIELCSKLYGDTFLIRYPELTNGGFLLISEPDAIREVMALSTDVASGGRANELWRPFFGDNSVTLLDGAKHQARRRMLSPPFHGDRMRTYGENMLAIAGEVVDAMPRGEPLALHRVFQDISLRIIIKVVFGVDDDSKREVARVIDNMLGGLTMVPGVLSFSFLRRDLGRFSPWGRFLANYRLLDRYLRAELERRRAAGAAGADVMSLLLSARDEDGQPMSLEAARDDLVTVLIAGHETTATTLAWSMHYLMKTPAVYDELVREIDGSLVDGKLSPERVAKLELLDAVVFETLRIQPVTPIIARVLTQPVRVAGYDLPKGSMVAINIYRAQRRPESYERPTEFYPQRFLTRKATPPEWVAFGIGGKYCIGAAFAKYEMKMTLAALLTRVRLRHARSARHVRPVRRLVTLAPSHGLRVVAADRDVGRL